MDGNRITVVLPPCGYDDGRTHPTPALLLIPAVLSGPILHGWYGLMALLGADWLRTRLESATENILMLLVFTRKCLSCVHPKRRKRCRVKPSKPSCTYQPRVFNLFVCCRGCHSLDTTNKNTYFEIKPFLFLAETGRLGDVHYHSCYREGLVVGRSPWHLDHARGGLKIDCQFQISDLGSSAALPHVRPSEPPMPPDE